MRLKKDERKYLWWRRQRIQETGSAKGRVRDDWDDFDDAPWLKPTKQEELIILRRRRGLTVRQAADLCLLSHVSVLQFESGAWANHKDYRSRLLQIPVGVKND